MTRRVVDLRQRGQPLPAPAPRPQATPAHPARGFTAALLTSLVVLPVVGARGQPSGLIAAILTAVGVLVLHRRSGGQAHWGWLAALVAAVEVVAPSADRSLIDPVLFVAFSLFAVLWLVHRAAATASESLERRPPRGSTGREAQEVLGRSGEVHVGSVLARDLPDDFVLVNGLKLRHAAGDIDHLVIGPTGVFLLETKTMAGRVVCNPDGSWQRTRQGRAGRYAAYIGDPAAQVKRNIHAVRRCLRSSLPRLFRGTPLWVEGLIVFPHPRTELAAAHSRVPAVRLNEAARTICEHPARRPLRPEDVDEVVGALLTQTEGRRC